jgi:tRNA(Arg) A34 adenosine deaminase TadA
MSNQQELWMREAISLSIDKLNEGLGGPFGAVVVQGDKIIGRGYNQVTALNDPSAHAEIVAIRQACDHLNHYHLEGCHLYTSCEPCPMCMGAIYWAHIEKVYYGNSNEDAAKAGFIDKFILEEFCKTPQNRQIEMNQMLPNEAIKAFNIWNNKKDKKEY